MIYKATAKSELVVAVITSTISAIVYIPVLSYLQLCQSLLTPAIQSYILLKRYAISYDMPLIFFSPHKCNWQFYVPVLSV